MTASHPSRNYRIDLSSAKAIILVFNIGTVHHSCTLVQHQGSEDMLSRLNCLGYLPNLFILGVWYYYGVSLATPCHVQACWLTLPCLPLVIIPGFDAAVHRSCSLVRHQPSGNMLARSNYLAYQAQYAHFGGVLRLYISLWHLAMYRLPGWHSADTAMSIKRTIIFFVAAAYGKLPCPAFWICWPDPTIFHIRPCAAMVYLSATPCNVQACWLTLPYSAFWGYVGQTQLSWDVLLCCGFYIFLAASFNVWLSGLLCVGCQVYCQLQSLLSMAPFIIPEQLFSVGLLRITYPDSAVLHVWSKRPFLNRVALVLILHLTCNIL